jgi:hypothetical protein
MSLGRHAEAAHVLREDRPEQPRPAAVQGEEAPRRSAGAPGRR